MSKGRLEAFSDGVLAIIITIMVLELRPPQGAGLSLLHPVVPSLLSYLLSFVFLGIYWNNHHHLFQAVQKVNGAILWANLHLLFWLSLVPFATAWMGQSGFVLGPVAVFCFLQLMAAIAYYFLVRALLAHHGKGSTLAKAIGNDRKGKVSLVVYVVALVLTFFEPFLSLGLLVLVAVMWIIPDRRIEKVLS